MIKYHDNNINPQYGEDGKLLDNWDANKHYADNEYCHVMFRIDTPSYRKQGVGFLNNEDRDAFYDEMFTVLKKIKFYPKSECEVINDKCELHIHPDILSGDVKKSDVKIIAETLENNKLFTIRWVDIYKDCFDITKEEQKQYLETKKNEIRKMIFQSCKTPRRNKFCYATDILSKIGNRFELEKLGGHFRSYYCYPETLEYMIEVTNELTKDGYIELWNDERNLYIRSLNKTELKELKLKELA